MKRTLKKRTTPVRAQVMKTQMSRRKLSRIIERYFPIGSAIECRIAGKWFSGVIQGRYGEYAMQVELGDGSIACVSLNDLRFGHELASELPEKQN